MTIQENTNLLEGDSLNIWNEIRGIKLDLFSLPEQVLENNVNLVPVSDGKVYLTLKASAVLPAMEEALKDKFNVEQNLKFVVISRIVK